MEEDEGDLFGGDMFEEPEGYFVEPPPHSHTSFSFKYTPPPSSSPLSSPPSPQDLPLRLVGSHVLWGHHQSEAGRLVADMISGSHPISAVSEQEQKENEHLYHPYLIPFLSNSGCPLEEGNTRLSIKGKRILELGGGTALPSLISVLCGAQFVVASDYSDPSLLDNISINVSTVLNSSLSSKIAVVGHIWGKDVTPLLQAGREGGNSDEGKFDLIILSDLVFNHSEHAGLLRSCRSCLAPGGAVLVVMIHHKPENEKKDTNFLLLAQQQPYAFQCQKIFHTRRPVTFPDDEGFEDVRSTAHVYCLY
uniref:Calmodulin-lysine N-methyltransferase n=1 Tax=Paramoeba aestuarina TaxID=180227 RepID=A0A7S4PI50_9EUKA